MKKIGIMGGTFDPIHLGHLILAETAYQELNLDEIWFVPSGNPPHKRNRNGGGTDEQRISMVSLAIEDNPHFSINLEDMVVNEYSYTYLLLERLKGQNPENQLYFIIGADSLHDFHKWKKPERICQLCTLAVAIRNQWSTQRLDEEIQKMSELFQGTFVKLHSPDIDISSNQLRSMISAGRSIRYYVPDKVREYIELHRMYKD